MIAYLAQHGYAGVVTNPTTSWQRQTLQRVIWCVSDGPANSKTNSADGWCALNFTDADFDAVSDLVPDDPNMVVTAETAGPLEIGEEARFTVRTNAFGQPIALGVTGPGAMSAAVCGGPGVLTAGELRVTGADTDVPETVTICVTSDEAGTIDLTAEVVVPHRDNLVWAWNGSPNCQVFATFSPAAATPLSGSAAAVVRAPQVPVDPVVPTIPTEPTVPDQPTTPVEPTIPAVPVTPTVPVSGVAPIINQAPRFAVAKRASVGRVLAGQRVRFTITVRNRGVAVRNLRVCDVLPDRTSVVSRSAGARVAGGRICWTVARVAPGRSVTRSVVLRVDQTAPAHRLVNRAVATVGRRSVSARATVLVRPVVRTVASQVTG